MNIRMGLAAARCVLAAVVLAVTAAACAASSSVPRSVVTDPGTGRHVTAAGSVVLDERSNNTLVQVAVGVPVQVVLHSSYWMNITSSQQTVLRQDGATQVLPATQRCVPGGGCRPLRTMFTAVNHGTAVISASRVSCGEALACGPADSHFRVTIVVTP